MQEDSFPAAERIISDIEAAFKKEPKLEEFDIVPVTSNENKSPVLVDGSTLGLESWCVRHVYCHAYNRLMDIRQHRRRGDDPEHVCRLLTTALLFNPDVSTLWNMRRELITTSRLDPHSELHFSSVILSKKPKSPEVFSHRKWLIKNLMKDFPTDPGLILNEFNVCEMAAERYPNNYHAWNHRIWSLDLALSSTSDDHQKAADILVDEWSRSQPWITLHISDHSGFQYRQHLFRKILMCGSSDNNACSMKALRRSTPYVSKTSDADLRSFLHKTAGAVKIGENDIPHTDPLKILTSDHCPEDETRLPNATFVLGLLCSEIMFNTDLMMVFPGHEALWCHRRFVLYMFHELLLSKGDPVSERIDSGRNCTRSKSDISPSEARRSYRNVDGVPFEKELKMDDAVDEMLLKTRLSYYEALFCATCRDDCQQNKHASRHRLWMERVLKTQLEGVL